ncbi:MAG: DUF305 domain-containing protein [Pleurocapsa sp. SU_5_0]|nr:DUF305 domain-containing protein [Pleurocapsa sp. SU_5_0]NJO98185.1 DUF305 domain-containing protein [Pleurocapsa sp. CRU_1_2]NJR45795.1 DUF305 domain-containing protein [Hyellaceae cyanobacterium CSU_1_1]
MHTILTKTRLVTLTFIGFSTLMVACTSAISNQTPASNTKATEASNKQDIKQHGDMMMQDGGMQHDMSMDIGPADADYDLRFIDSMLMHHQGAVNMAQEALTKSQRPEMKKLAQDIITAQKQEIEQMKQWRTTWYPNANQTPMAWSAEMGHMMAMSEDMEQSMMMSMDLGKADPDFDLRFIDAMIPHHEGALVMAKDALGKTKRPDVKKLSQDILNSQQQEIEQMKQWRKDWDKK